MSELYEKSLIKLELRSVLEKLAGFAGSHEAKRRCLCLSPSSNAETVKHLLEETNAASKMITQKSTLSFSGAIDPSTALDRADRGGSLSPKELLDIALLLKTTRTARNYITDDEEHTVLTSLFRSLSPNRYLEEKIYNAIISEDEISDAASSDLADIRRHKRIQTGKIREGLQKVISSPAYSKFLRDPIITIRQGRYVVPVKSECKNDVPGLVHDVSATGSTYFIEPMSAVNANNTLRELELKEQKEIERILAEMSAEVAAHRADIEENFSLLVSLDVVFAKARLGFEMKAWAPDVNEAGIIELNNARHPLIDAKTVVPISVRLGTDFDTMIITGPNTGGKTVTLKTIGLLTLMAECGLYIPAGSGSRISTFDAILADIGDEQSIAQSLSTFSSHMKTIVDVVTQCDQRTLVLFDELGAGTDPAEGAALAMAIIEYCRKMGSKVVATTHYAELKLYAMRTPNVMNASCEFNVETLRPTYKLLIGIPGKSNAFAISQKLGLMDDILKEADKLVGQNDKDFEDVLAKLENQRQQMERSRLEAERLQKEISEIKNQSQAYHDQLKREKERALEAARREAMEIIADARRTADAAVQEIKELKKQIAEHSDTSGINQRQSELRRGLNEAQSRIQATQQERERPKETRKIIIGDTVELIKLGTKASVIAINKDGTYELQAGILKLNAKREEIYLLENESSYSEKKLRPAHSGRTINASTVSSEIDLRGMDTIEAVCVMERYIDEAMRCNLQSIRIIHGKGTGAVRAAVHQALKKNKQIKNFRLGRYGEGEDGVTIAEVR